MKEAKIVGTASATNPDIAYKTLLSSRQFSLIADEPATSGGNDLGPAPGDFLCMSLAACKAITLRMYARRKQWEVGEITVSVNLVKTEDASGTAINTFHSEVSATGDLTNEQKQRLLQIEKACPVSKLLVKGAEMVSTIN